LITWFLTGLWHGANYTFIVWGLFHGVFLIIHRWQSRPRKKLLKSLGIRNSDLVVVIPETVFTIIIIIISWIIFRSGSLVQSGEYLSILFSSSLFTIPEIFPKRLLILIILFIAVEIIQRNKQHVLQLEQLKYRVLRWGVYIGLIIVISLSKSDPQEFIYFQF
ncbi:MAG TPA: hypothetical protein DDW27_12895, partial [Bacteroidales bacterium]|nr:hypothetical protein [Bacteroidales bacterium]